MQVWEGSKKLVWQTKQVLRSELFRGVQTVVRGGQTVTRGVHTDDNRVWTSAIEVQRGRGIEAGSGRIQANAVGSQGSDGEV
jgi:hypothetical protein